MGRKKKEGGTGMYFRPEHQDAIVKYNASVDPDERERLFSKEIYPAMDKMVENIINRFKFPYIDENYFDLKSNVMSFIVLNMHKFKPDCGNAFGYFSVMAKNYLILHNSVAYRDDKRIVSIDDSNDDNYANDEMFLVNHPGQNDRDISDFIHNMISFWDINIPRVFKKKRDIQIANAVIELFRQSNNIENHNKKALFLMLREMTGYDTNCITKVITKMKAIVTRHLNDYRVNSTFTMEPNKFLKYKNNKKE